MHSSRGKPSQLHADLCALFLLPLLRVYDDMPTLVPGSKVEAVAAKRGIALGFRQAAGGGGTEVVLRGVAVPAKAEYRCDGCRYD